MMEWYQILSYICTNGIRFFLCLCLISQLLVFQRDTRKIVFLSVGAAVIITAVSLVSVSQIIIIGAEIIALLAAGHFLFREKTRMSFFVIFFYEVAVALWEFILSAGLGVAFHSQRFIDSAAPEYVIAVWIVRLLMLGIAVFAVKGGNTARKSALRLASVIAFIGMFGVIALASQNTIPISDDQLTTWIILSLLLIVAVQLFNLNRQYEIEKEIARLKADQVELLERDYQTLNRSYSANAKLFHDLHNHIEIMHRYLIQEKISDAVQYLEDLRTPVQEITQSNWTGDEAIDYLISSKIAYADRAHIAIKVNIEFPRHTNIRNADLTAILGNLLDNALEAAESVKEELRFIHLTIRRINKMLVIKIENRCEVAPAVNNGELLSTKPKDGLHGWGLKSVRATAEKYDGIVETTYEKNLFRTVVTLFYEAVKTK